MVLSRTLNKLICRVLIGAFLFAQFAVAAYSCPRLKPAATMHAVATEVAMQGGCDQMDPKAPNLCAEHCKHGQQISDTASVPPLFTPSLALLYLFPAEDFGDSRAGSSAPAPSPLLAAPPPPHAILHCVLRI